MSNKHLLPLHTNSANESPLDLTVKRSDMDSNDPNNYLQQSFTATIATLNNPLSDYTPYQQNNPGVYYENNGPFSQIYDVNSSIYPSSTSQNLNIPPPSSFSAPSSPVHDVNSRQFQHGATNSSILPKKRKNLWRPYDKSALRRDSFSDDKETDSGSESGSNSSSDQEFKTPETPLDPMKRRKRNMLKYAEEHMDDFHNNFNNQQSHDTSSQMKSSSAMENNDISVPSSSDRSIDTYVPSVDVPDGSDVREHVISGMKKRDIFGWSIKLAKQSENVNMAVSDGPNVCQDGDKTYFELQTVRKNSSSEDLSQISHKENPVKQGNLTSTSPRQQNTKQSSSTTRRSGANKKAAKEVEKENSRNVSSNRVYIQRRDNVIESYDETENVPKKLETEKKLSLIDLVQEIEADALKQDKEEADKTHKRNMGIVKLLEQCNHVKLQALDYLMSNVLIQEKGQSFKNKNETVQKMLNGDKIGKVSMLDVVELQVEMGLN